MASALASAARFTRASWLRDSAAYLNRALVHPNASFFLFSHGRPLVRRTEPGRLASFPWPAVAPTVLHSVRLIAPDAQDVFGPEAYGLEKHPDADSRWWNDNTQGIISPTLSLTFLGIREDGTPPQSLTDGERQLVVPSGTPTFALSLSHHPQGEPVPPAHELARALADDYEALDMRAINMGGALNPSETAIVAYARSLLDWNDRYRFCTGCGSRQYSIWAGHKRGCASSLAARTAASSPFVRAVHPTYSSAQPCASTQSLQNYSYPRTDPAVVIGIISADGDHILLGRQKNFPKGLYSCISCVPADQWLRRVWRDTRRRRASRSTRRDRRRCRQGGVPHIAAVPDARKPPHWRVRVR